MKKLKIKIVLSLLAICSLLLVGAGKVYADQPELTRPRIICSPDKLEVGETTRCMFVVNYLNDVPLYAINTNVYLEDLELKTKSAASITSGYGNTVGVEYKSAIGQEFDHLHDASSNKAKCESVIGKSGEFCALFYSSASGTKSVKRNPASGQDYTIIGNYDLKLVGNSQNIKRCGKICLYAFKYDEDKQPKAALTTTSGGECVELTVAGTDQPTPPPTGNFASYAILAAGAFIAICAVVVAKKNNKFYRV